MADKICVITGVGPGTGASLTRRFAAGGYRVAMLARNAERLAALETEVPGAKAFPCDVSDPAQVTAAAEAIRRELGEPSVVIHNAVGGAFGTFLDIDPEVLNRNFQTNAMGLLYLARALRAGDGRKGRGRADRDRQHFGPARPGEFRRLRPDQGGAAHPRRSHRARCRAKGVHVAYVVIDAVIDVPWAKERFKGKPDDFFIKSSAIADEVFHLAHQDRSAWSFNVEIRPYGETW